MSSTGSSTRVSNGTNISTGGRPPSLLIFNADAGLILAADLGATHARLAVTNLAREVLVETEEEEPIAAEPDVKLGDLEALQGVVKFPVRIKCATLSWNTLQQGLDEALPTIRPADVSAQSILRARSSRGGSRSV